MLININKMTSYTYSNPKRQWCIVKLSPLTKIEKIDEYYNNGFRQFHCSNTLQLRK